MVTASKTTRSFVGFGLLCGLASCHASGTLLDLAADSTVGPTLDGYCVALTASGTRRFGARYSTATQQLPQSLGVEPHGQKAMIARLDGYAKGVRVASTAQSVVLPGPKDPTLTLSACVPGQPSVGASKFHPRNGVTKIADELAFMHTGLEAPGASSFAALGNGVGLVATYINGSLVQANAPTPTSSVNALVATDAESACADDLVLAPQSTQPILWSDGTDGSFAVSSSGAGLPASLGPAQALVAGDLDGDGIADLVGVGPTASSSYVLIGDGHGGYATRQGFDTAPLGGQAAVLGDLNGDGLLDLAVGFSNAVRLWIGDGHGDFRLSGNMLATGNVTAVALLDVDGDGQLDVLAAMKGMAPGLHVLLNNKAVLNDATPAWVPSTLDSDGQAVAVTDVDGDCAQEILFGGTATAARLLRVVAGQLQDTGPVGSSPVHSLGAADLDGDGLPELVLLGFTDIEIWGRQ